VGYRQRGAVNRARGHEDGKWSELIAPISGQVSKIHHAVGDSVANGQKVFTIVAEQGRTITTYLRSDQRVAAEPGMTVSVRQRSDAGKTFSAIVERVGVQYESVPAAQLRDHKTRSGAGR